MGRVVTLAERYEKYSAKLDPTRVGRRYGNSKPIALVRFIQGSAKPVAIREIVKNILDVSGVPAAQYALYLSFAMKVVKFTDKYTGETLRKRVEGAKAGWLQRGADPSILEKIVKLFP